VHFIAVEYLNDGQIKLDNSSYSDVIFSDPFTGNITDEVLSLNYAQDVEGSKDKKRNGMNIVFWKKRSYL